MYVHVHTYAIYTYTHHNLDLPQDNSFTVAACNTCIAEL